MSTNPTPELPTVMRRAIAKALRRVRVALPGRVEEYDPTTCSASVQPLVLDARFDPSGVRVTERLAVNNHVPVVFLGGGGSRLTFPVKRGDEGVILYGSSAIGQYLALGGEQDPVSDQHHHLSDAIAFFVFDVAEPDRAPANADATVLEGTDVRLGDDAGGALATKADVDALATWIHTVMIVNATGAIAGTTTPPPSATGTLKVKAT